MKKVLMSVLMILLLSGCQSVEYYQQAIAGQAGLMWQRQSIESLVAKGGADPALRYRLELVTEMLRYAERQGLSSNGAYQSYVETGQPYVIWNVFAARPFELTLKTSCFPIAGCVSYRGYFKKEDAQAHARQLEQEGYEVFVGGVAAYSTLGWFDDPLLDTFLFRSEEQLAALLFHELAHQLIYVKDDTRFNESAATAVERYLLKKWLTEKDELSRFDQVMASQRRQQSVVKLINTARDSLKGLYASEKSRDVMRTQKNAILTVLVADYEALASSWSEGEEYRRWMQGAINNAKLETVADYNEWVPVLMMRLEEMGMSRFEKELARLANLSSTDRERDLLQQ